MQRAKFNIEVTLDLAGDYETLDKMEAHLIHMLDRHPFDTFEEDTNMEVDITSKKLVIKPYRGRIVDWDMIYQSVTGDNYNDDHPYKIRGTHIDKPGMAQVWITSTVVLHNHKTGEIETKNSRYLLVPNLDEDVVLPDSCEVFVKVDDTLGYTKKIQAVKAVRFASRLSVGGAKDAVESASSFTIKKDAIDRFLSDLKGSGYVPCFGNSL